MRVTDGANLGPSIPSGAGRRQTLQTAAARPSGETRLTAIFEDTLDTLDPLDLPLSFTSTFTIP
jgi:hypothetical protein